MRVLLADRRSAGFRAQMVMLGVACVLFSPVLAGGSLWGQAVAGFVSPVGVSIIVGAFIFGTGMQLGGGSTRMLVTLLFFVVGSVVGVTHLAWWERLSALSPVSLITVLGWPLALALNLAVGAAAYGAVWRLERARHGSVVSIATSPSINAGAGTAPGAERAGAMPWLRDPWLLLAGALALALLNFVTLSLAGRPWGITSAYGLWGGMLLQAAGVPVTGWSGYSSPEMQAELHQCTLADITERVNDFAAPGVMNLLCKAESLSDR